MSQPNVYIETYGCQMNVLDSELVRDQFTALGYNFVDRPQDAKVVLLNTCSIRDLSEQKVWSKLGRLGISKRDSQPDLVIGVLGCMAEREGREIMRRMPQVDVLCGPSELDRLPGLVSNALLNRGEGAERVALSGHTSRRSKTLDAAGDGLENLDLSRSFSPTDSKAQAYVRITRGCNKFCAFCVVPYTRGPEVHRPPEHIVEEVKGLLGRGVLEVTLLGQTVNHYEYSDGGHTTSFADLLRKVHEEVPDLPRLRFLTSYPRDFTDDALDAMAASPRICKYLHIPVQSGSNRMLKAMNRGYTIEEYDGLLERARARMPNIRLAGDMIVGFPGETDEDHQMSVDLLKRARYKSCFIFKYSPRSGTVAERRFEDDIPDAIKKERNLDLLEVQGQVSRELYQEYVGQSLEVIVEGFNKLKHTPKLADAGSGQVMVGWQQPKPKVDDSEWVRLRGRTEGDEIVAFDGPASLVGTITHVDATDCTHLTIMGQWTPGQVTPVAARVPQATAPL